jgi:ribosome-associated translation inhibitor RaiA
MRLEIRRHGVPMTESLRTHLKEKLQTALDRFARRIALVRVSLRDENGPRGGRDQRCRLVVEIPPRGRVVVAGTDTDLMTAITRTARRAGFAVKRLVQRRRLIRRRRPRRRPLAATV